MPLNRFHAVLGLTLALVLAVPAHPQQRGRLLQQWMAKRAAAADADAPALAAPRTLSFGADPKQAYDYWPAAAPAGTVRPPLIVFVHGGAWSIGDKSNGTGKWKPAHFTAAGYAFASVDYRLVPQVSVEDEAGDVAHALRHLIDHAGDLGFDPARVVLMGHSAGAHLVALVATDERYLKAAGLSFASLKGVMPIDGAGYDVPRQMAGNAPRLLQAKYEAAFGSDPARQRALSPTFAAAAGAGHLPPFLLIHVQRPDGVAQAEELEAALKAAGAAVSRQGFPGEGLSGHLEINRRLGDPAYPATGVVDGWLRARLAGR